MPPMESSDRNQFGVMWAPAGHTRTGDKKVSAGVELGLRWEDATETNRPNKSDEEQFDAMIVVGQDILVGSIFWKGKSDDLPSPVTDVTNLYEVIIFRKIPDVKGRNFRRTCLLKKWSDTLPTIV